MERTHTFQRSNYLTMSPDKRLIALADGSQIHLFDAESYRPVAQFREVPDPEIFFSGDGSLLLAKNSERKLAVFDMETMRLKKKLLPKRGTRNGDGQACFSADQTQVFHLGIDFPYGYLSVFGLEDGKETRYLEGRKEVYDHIRYVPSCGKYFIDGFRRLDNGSGEGNQYFFLWFDAENQTVEQTFCGSRRECFLYAERLNEVVSYTPDGELELRRYPSGTEWKFPNDTSRMHEARLSQDNSMIALYREQDLSVHRFPEMDLLESFTGIGYGRAEFSPDDQEFLVSTVHRSYVYRISGSSCRKFC